MLLAALLIGCSYELTLSDGLGPTQDLHQPWLPGSSPRLIGVPNRLRSDDQLDITITDTSVAEITSWGFEDSELAIDVLTHKPGDTQLLVRKAANGEVAVMILRESSTQPAMAVAVGVVVPQA